MFRGCWSREWRARPCGFARARAAPRLLASALVAHAAMSVCANDLLCSHVEMRGRTSRETPPEKPLASGAYEALSVGGTGSRSRGVRQGGSREYATNAIGVVQCDPGSRPTAAPVWRPGRLAARAAGAAWLASAASTGAAAQQPADTGAEAERRAVEEMRRRGVPVPPPEERRRPPPLTP